MSWHREASAWSAVLLTLLPAARCADMRIVMTSSIPLGLYATHELVRGEQVHVGDYVCLSPTEATAPLALREGIRSGLLPRDWARRPLMKRVGAVAGDVVSYGAEGVRVNGSVLPSTVARTRDSHGNPLPKPAFPLQLQHEQVWLTSEHVLGFDSRYFGAVGTNALSCVGSPVWTI